MLRSVSSRIRPARIGLSAGSSCIITSVTFFADVSRVEVVMTDLMRRSSSRCVTVLWNVWMGRVMVFW